MFPVQMHVHPHGRAHMLARTFSLSQPYRHVETKMISHSKETPTVFQREVCNKNGELKQEKKKKGEGEEVGRSGHGGLYVLVKVALRNKSSFECAPTQKRD